jgi:hypothetical protein
VNLLEGAIHSEICLFDRFGSAGQSLAPQAHKISICGQQTRWEEDLPICVTAERRRTGKPSVPPEID